ncbi:MAG: UTP--glucose-1-phosphate uridylyltransferase [Clostridia bacterium]|nr:UTP--glucose-1-phosphate uridylyltransferase [Clostridia bacterium]
MKEELKNIITKLERNNQKEIVNLITNVYSDEENEKIASQIERINIEKVMSLYNNATIIPFVDQSKIEHIKYTDLSSLKEEEFRAYKDLGEKIIKSNKYAVITMAGGQGTRLGHKGPKGTFKINTVNGEKYLFEVIVNSLQKANNKYGVVIPWYVMTSEDNNDQTISFLEEHNYFGYSKDKVKFFKQGQVPMVKTDGNIVVDKNKLIKEASDGNGSIYKSIKRSGLLEQMKADSIEWIFVGGVDNILLRIVDPVMVGLTIKENNMIASKTVAKRNPEEKAGVFCKLNGVPKVIEYTELPKAMAEEVDENGKLRYGDINILSHLFNINALEKLAEIDLPYHTAFKKSDYLNENGEVVEVSEPNAYKFESYIFDGFSFFDNMSILRVKREDEFAPIKNATGSDSPETAVALYDEYNKKYNK